MIWLIGCNGNLGTEIARLLEKNGVPFYATDRRVDVSDYGALKAYAAGKPIDWIINCAAYTEVDKAEDEVERAFLVNGTGARNCALLARETGARLIHISTDYVFDGNVSVPYTEDAPAAPLSVYGASKAAGEKAVRNVIPGHYILRTAWLYGFAGSNFVNTMLRILNDRDCVKVVSDQMGTPTSACTLASVIIRIIENGDIPFGTYNCTDLGETTWYGFACTIREEAVNCGMLPSSCAVVAPCSTAEYPARAKRPAYSVLSKERLQSALGIELPDWRISLRAFLEDLCGN